MTPKMKWMFAILALSVAGNLFAAGIWLGKEFKPGGGRKGGGSPIEHVEFNMRKLTESLPEDKRLEIRRIFMADRETMREHFMSMRMSEARIRAVLTAETVDIAALEEALDSHQDILGKFRNPMKRVMTEVIATLDQETRKSLVENMWQARRGPGRFGRRGPGMGPPGGPGMGPPGPPPHMMPPPGEDGEKPPHDEEDDGSQ